MVSEYRHNKWREHLEESDLGSRRLWATIKNLTNPRKSENIAISFGTNTPLDPTKCAQAFCRQFVEHPTKPDKNLRVVKRKIRKLLRSEEISFSAEDVLTAIKTAKPSTAIGLYLLATSSS